MSRILLSKILKEQVIGPDYYYEQGDQMGGDVKALELELERKYPELADLSLAAHTNGSIYISSIRVKKSERGKGVGGKVMAEIKKFAAKHKLAITLTPEAEKGKKGALDKFYRNQGFWSNSGHKTDYRYTSAFAPIMIWKPNN